MTTTHLTKKEKSMNLKKIIATLAVALTLILGLMLFNLGASAAGTNRYVANGGSDTTDCSSSSTPCATIQYAVSQSSANDTINVMAGTYTENVDRKSTRLNSSHQIIS